MKDFKDRLSLAVQYENARQDREMWLGAAKEAAKYTIPAIMPEDCDTKTKSRRSKTSYKQPNQSVGADGINNLASKVTLTLLPPNQTFFKFSMDKDVIRQQAMTEGVEAGTYENEINQGLAKLESILLNYMESSCDRVCLGEALKHLYITGNVLLLYEADKGLKYYPLNRYVIKRDYCGNTQYIITEESIGFYELPVDIQKQLIDKYISITDDNETELKKIEDKEFTVYTGIFKRTNTWEVWQEIDEFKIKQSIGSYPLDIIPAIPLRYVRVDGESYGRGLVEDYFADISYLDTISLAMKEASLAGAKLIMLVNPNGQTQIRKLASAKNGDYVAGKADDVTPLQANKYYDLQTAQVTADKIEKRLNRIFIMKAAIQRDGERVTAEEIRQLAGDLEEALGNHYSLMAKEFQLAYVKLVYFHLKKKRKLPDLLQDKTINLTITTGLEALGKTSDLNKLVTFFDMMGKLAQSAQVIGAKIEPIAQAVASSLNLDVTGFLYTEEEKAQMQQQQQEAELMNRTAPNVVNKLGEAMLQQQEGEINGEQS